MVNGNPPKVSVIVPVFNSEQYLVQCLDSVVDQTLADIEIILVNDGSTDSSGEICHEYSSRDPRIQVKDKQNGGLASARNAGLAVATGEYIGFVDSDDWIEPNMYERMYSVATQENCDIVWTNAFRNEDEKLNPHMTGGVFDRDAIETLIFPRLLAVVDERTRQEGVLRWSNCLRIYRRKLIQNHGIRFDDRFRRCQDLPFTFECTIQSEKYAYLDKDHLYHNRVNPDSLSRSYTHEMWALIKPIVVYLGEITKNYRQYDFSQQVKLRAFLFGIEAVQNEAKTSNRLPLTTRLRKIRTIFDDPVIRDSLFAIKGCHLKRINIAFYVAFKWRIALMAYCIAKRRNRTK